MSKSADAAIKKFSAFVSAVDEEFGLDCTQLTRSQLMKLKSEKGLIIPWNQLHAVPGSKPQSFSFTRTGEMDSVVREEKIEKPKPIEPEKPVEPVKTEVRIESSGKVEAPSPVMRNYVPQKDSMFVECGDNYDIVKRIVSTKRFYPTYIYGIPGLGKTTMVEQACANCGREFFRCQITRETIDEDLIGTMHLEDGNTVWADGPVMKAYRSGGVLLLDEIDLNPYLMILQGILEGKPFYIKQTGEVVKPAPGFTIFATGNSKGLGESEFIGTTALNEAQRDRFAMYLEQGIPSISVEKRIANRYIKMENLDIDDKIKDSVFSWVALCRKSYEAGNLTQYISTRRIHFLFKSIDMLGKPEKALDATLSCYEDETKEALTMLWRSCYKEEETKVESEETEEMKAEATTTSEFNAPRNSYVLSHFDNGTGVVKSMTLYAVKE